MNTTQAAGWALIAIVGTTIVSTEIKRAIAQPVPAVQSAGKMSQPHAAYAHAAMQQQAGQGRYGLVQTGIVGVAQLGPTGSFGQPTPMPIFHMVQLQSPMMHPAAAHLQPNLGSAQSPMLSPMPGQQALAAPKIKANAQQPAATADVPPGITIAPQASTQPIGTWCSINSVRVLTQTADACRTAGGSVTSH